MSHRCPSSVKDYNLVFEMECYTDCFKASQFHACHFWLGFFFSVRSFEWCPDVIFFNRFNKIWSVLGAVTKVNEWLDIPWAFRFNRVKDNDSRGVRLWSTSNRFTLMHNVEKICTGFKGSLVSLLCFRFYYFQQQPLVRDGVDMQSIFQMTNACWLLIRWLSVTVCQCFIQLQ